MPYTTTHVLVTIIALELFRDYYLKNNKKFPSYYILIGAIAAIFPDVESGHNALLDLLSSVYANYSIDRMIMKFAPPKENPVLSVCTLL